MVDIDKTIDAGNANSDLLNNRMNMMNSLLDLDKLKSLEVAQKAKIKWFIEGDENSKYFHENDVMEAVSYFFQHGSFPKGGNSSFIALIPKTQNASMVLLGDIISDVKSAFVADRQILEDVKEKKVSLVNWNKVMASKDRARFIKAMHGKDGHLGTTVKSPFPFIWLDLIRELDNLKNQGIDLLGLIKKKIGNGFDTSFWDDVWKGDIAFKFLYPRIYKLETCKQINVATKLVHDNVRLTLTRLHRGGAELEQFNDLINSLVDLQLPNMQDRWFWSLSGSGDFSVASVRQFIDDHLLPELSSRFCWRKIVPIKVNILAWKVKLDVSSFEEWEVWMSSLVLSSKRKQLLEGVTYIAWWLLWNFRNKLVFGSTIHSKAVLFDDIVARSFQCVSRASLSNSPNVEKANGMNLYPLSAHIDAYFLFFFSTTLFKATSGAQELTPVPAKGEMPVTSKHASLPWS
ncbi:hypothetical protein Tco_0919661 [Tanacetum coccineum]